MTPLASDTPPAAAAPPSGVPRMIAPLLVLLLVGVAAFWYFARPRSELAFTNRLMAPVRLVIGRDTRTVAAGGTVRLPLPRGQTTVAEWELVRPLSPDGELLGVPLRGSIVADGKGRVERVAESWGADADYFAPLITNTTGVPLRILINVGSKAPQDCRCAVSPQARRAFIGYYPLYANSTVQAKAGDRSATFRDLGHSVNSADGSVGLAFNSGDLRP